MTTTTVVPRSPAQKGYDCRDCGTFHLGGQHTPAGLAKIQARYADPAYKNRARSLKCFGCGSSDHLLAVCPDPHKLQVAAKAAETHAADVGRPLGCKLGTPIVLVACP